MSRDRGLYETLMTEALEEQLRGLGDRLEARRSDLHEAEAADRIALHLSRVLETAIAALDRKERVAVGTLLARQLVQLIVQSTRANELEAERPIEPGEMLRSVLGRLPDGRFEEIPAPLVPLLDTTLLTNAPRLPRCSTATSKCDENAFRTGISRLSIQRL
jgi:hypothetical protein